jgi:hypothetical protein
MQNLSKPEKLAKLGHSLAYRTSKARKGTGIATRDAQLA